MKTYRRINLTILCALALVSIFIATRASLVYENMTYVGNLAQYRPLFLVWGIGQSLFYGVLYIQVVRLYRMRITYLHVLAFIAVMLNIISFLLPYQNHSGDVLSQLHVYASLISCVITCLVVARVLMALQHIDFIVFMRGRTRILALSSVIFCMAFLFGDFSSAMELVFTNGLSYLLYSLLYP